MSASKDSKAPHGTKDRARELSQRQQLKMARNAHAYVRGSTAKFYEWLEREDRKVVPQGPPIWICGDCHIGNLGPVANADGRVEIEIRDLDQAVIGNPAHDLIRLSLSLAMAARGSDLPGVTTARMLEAVTLGYQQALLGVVHDSSQTRRRPKDVTFVMKEAMRRNWVHLLEERIDNVKPTIPRNDKFWSISKKDRQAVEDVFQSEDIRRLVTSLRVRDDDAAMNVLDVAYWVKGCSSLGRLRLAALVSVAPKKAKARAMRGDLCLIDVKEASASCAPSTAKKEMPKDHAQRVVTAARALAPFLGERMLATEILGRSVFVRELLPQDLKIEIDEISQEEAIAVAHFLATIVGRAHARQMDHKTRRAWCADLKKRMPKTLDAPSWLWSSVVDLVAVHETAYLEHCRRYALDTSAKKLLSV